jgi:nucleotide-binding universal stress UspA family protein
MLVIGARGVHGWERAVLGSVADGCVKRATMPVLIVH